MENKILRLTTSSLFALQGALRYFGLCISLIPTSYNTISKAKFSF